MRVGSRSLPFRVVAADAPRVELEIAGERVTVEGWPPGLAEPADPVAVNGERVASPLRVVVVRAQASARIPRQAASEAPRRPDASAPPAGEGQAVVPAMPGKVIELKVAEGQEVEVGEVLLILEAMKMRNEVVAPVAGRVRDLKVAPGSSVRAREPMLRIVPA